MRQGIECSGVITEKELLNLPGVPSIERLKRGPVAVIECAQEIPCDPCELACPSSAIKIGKPITNLPILSADKCHGCGLCVSACPGLAIFIVDMTYSKDKALLKIPYEYLPLPRIGSIVKAVDRSGKVVGEGKIISVKDTKRQDRTPIVSLVVPKGLGMKVRDIKR